MFGIHFSEGPAYEMVTEKEASQLLDSITTPWFHQVGAHIGHLFKLAAQQLT